MIQILTFEQYDSSMDLGERLLSTLDESNRLTPVMKRAIRDFLRQHNNIRNLNREIVSAVGSANMAAVNPGRYEYYGVHGEIAQVRMGMGFSDRRVVVIEFEINEDVGRVVGWSINP